MSESASTSLRAIVAMASNRIIGSNGDLPWRIPEDLKWFKKITLGHPIVMGRKTMESLRGPLPGRTNYVLTRSETELPDGFVRLSDVSEVDNISSESGTVFVIGGAEIYRMLIPECDEVYLSYVFEPYDGDTKLHEWESGFDLEETMFRNDEFELRRYVRSS
ncbi:MAG: dihydrofolate reductase [Verrucomicrobiota bacterium]